MLRKLASFAKYLLFERPVIETKNFFHPLGIRSSIQASLYQEFQLYSDRSFLIATLNKTLECLDLDLYSELNGMYSEHLLIFTALSLSDWNPKRILEIGTHDGRTASILSLLFPTSEIVTIDLKDDDPLFSNSYNRSNPNTLNKFITDRNNKLRSLSNVHFEQINSLNLINFGGNTFDLIWVDGAHGYPVAACDIANAIRLCTINGFVMCDDVWKQKSKQDGIYNSMASFETLQALSEADLITFSLFKKRLDKRFLLSDKYVALVKPLKSEK